MDTLKETFLNKKIPPFDKFFFTTVILLLIAGLFMFVSASLGILAKNPTKFYGVLFNQIVLGLGAGSLALYVGSRIPFKFWRAKAFWIFILSIGTTALVFVPGLGFKHGGAQRWLSLGPLSFQPAELLKIGFIIYFAGWLSWAKGKVREVKYGLLPLVILLGIIATVLFLQPDTKSFMLMTISAICMLIMAQVPWKHLFGMLGIVLVGLGILVVWKPYLRERVMTFANPNHDTSGASFQVNQAWIAIGSGGVFGRGYGQSIQKFSYLPEPQGDSIFAVVGEEMGLLGSTILLILYVVFSLRGLKIASETKDLFGKLLVTGLVILLTSQSFLNIASIVGLFPLTGVPLVFMSHGGTALLFSLFSVGIILNVSRYNNQKQSV